MPKAIAIAARKPRSMPSLARSRMPAATRPAPLNTRARMLIGAARPPDRPRAGRRARDRACPASPRPLRGGPPRGDRRRIRPPQWERPAAAPRTGRRWACGAARFAARKRNGARGCAACRRRRAPPSWPSRAWRSRLRVRPLRNRIGLAMARREQPVAEDAVHGPERILEPDLLSFLDGARLVRDGPFDHAEGFAAMAVRKQRGHLGLESEALLAQRQLLDDVR